jgi:hypothetical protein
MLKRQESCHLKQILWSPSCNRKRQPPNAFRCQALVTYSCNPSYWGGRDQGDGSSKPAKANISSDITSKIPLQKRLAELLKWYRLQCLPNKPEALSLKPTATQKNSQRHNFNLIPNDCPVLLNDWNLSCPVLFSCTPPWSSSLSLEGEMEPLESRHRASVISQ